MREVGERGGEPNEDNSAKVTVGVACQSAFAG